MGEIKIESGIPIPERISNFAKKYPWKEMKVGDSIFVDRINGEPVQLTRERASKAITYAKKFGIKFCTRAAADGSGVRIWRIE